MYRFNISVETLPSVLEGSFGVLHSLAKTETLFKEMLFSSYFPFIIVMSMTEIVFNAEDFIRMVCFNEAGV